MKRSFSIIALLLSVTGLVAWLGRERVTTLPRAQAEEISVGSTAPVLTPAPQSPEREKKKETEAASQATPSPAQEAFRRLAKTTWDAIPLKASLQERSSAQLHTTPDEIRQAGERIGQIEDAMAADASLMPLGLRFFGNCARNDAFPSSIRALCYRSLTRFGATPSLSESEVPLRIRALAEQLDEH